jgi:hypothetical protein
MIPPLARAIERFGHLDVAFNNAGTLGTRGAVAEQSAANAADGGR